ncbi:hypothetical protein B0H14DRAFT_328163 [Mycena olivaceomarginata]|nr:hypothetical protein B0H14DRAFT_328163 [Mycena olivaceomarginata]
MLRLSGDSDGASIFESGDAAQCWICHLSSKKGELCTADVFRTFTWLPDSYDGGSVPGRWSRRAMAQGRFEILRAQASTSPSTVRYSQYWAAVCRGFPRIFSSDSGTSGTNITCRISLVYFSGHASKPSCRRPFNIYYLSPGCTGLTTHRGYAPSTGVLSIELAPPESWTAALFISSDFQPSTHSVSASAVDV